MSEVEKQESQKTVVAFITGLLIGGLLVWVFSSTPEDKVTLVEEKVTKDTSTEVKATEEKKTEIVKTTEAIEEGSIIVLEQKAGKSITLGATKYPTNAGWVVIRDYMDGVPGNILGAARYDVAEGLLPTSVDLMRSTTAGSSYQVVFYTNGGTTGFATAEDTLIDGISTTFKAN